MNILEAIDRLQGVREGLVVLGDHDELREFSGYLALLVREIDSIKEQLRK